MQVHVSKQSNIPDHCRAYALSDPKDKDYQMTCPHDHLENCDRCELLASVLADIHDALEKMSNRNVSRDVIEELTFVKGQAKQNILAWKAHFLRCVNRDEARLEVINALDESSVLPVQDWAMKFLPRKFRESQSDWFAKKRHVLAHYRSYSSGRKQRIADDHLRTRFPNRQPRQLRGAVKAVIGKLKSLLPQLKSVFYRQDNAGCYHCGATIVGASF